MNTELPLQHYIDELDAIISAVTEAGLQESAALLKIARLDLLVRSNGISEDELDVLLSVVHPNVDWSLPGQIHAQPRAGLAS
jgi:site-specific recombinase XerC